MAALGTTEAKGGRDSGASVLGRGTAGTDTSPLFADMMDRVAEACLPSFEKLAGENIAVSCYVTSVTQDTASEVIAAGASMITALFEIPALATRLAISLEDDFLQLFVEIMCGGTAGEASSAAPRPTTSIDRQFARVALNTLSATFAAECTGYGLSSLTFGQIQAKPDPGALGKRNAKVTVATFSMECLGRDGSFHVVFPQAVMERFKQDALPAAKQPVARVDPEWSGRLQAEISRTTVSLDAFLEADKLTLGQIAGLKIGQIVTLPKTAPSRCELRCDDKPLFRCELGQADGRYSLRIESGLPSAPARDVSPADAYAALSE